MEAEGGEERAGRCSSIPISIKIGNPSPGNSHYLPFAVRAETSAMNNLALNTQPITLSETSIPEWDACGAPSLPAQQTQIPKYSGTEQSRSLMPFPQNVTEGETLEATDNGGFKYLLHGAVKYKDYADYRKRRNSFPKMSALVKTPEELADAGFIYHSEPDSVLCFCCGVGFKDWKPDDDPWRDHAHQSPNCLYVQAKGSQFVQQQMGTPNSSTAVRQQAKQLRNVGSSSPAEEEKMYQALNDIGYSTDKIHLAVGCLQRKGIQIDIEKIANKILDMDQEKQGRVIIQCFQCHEEMRDGYTLLPCGHVAVCLNCHVKNIKVCPVCKEKVEHCVVTYPHIIN